MDQTIIKDDTVEKVMEQVNRRGEEERKEPRASVDRSGEETS